MKPIILGLLLSMCAASANAALITYSYNDLIANQYEAYNAVGIFKVDSQKRGLVSVQFESEPVTFTWEGFAPLMYEQPVSDVGQLYENGFESFTTDYFECFLFLDMFFLEAGEDIFHNLHKTAPFEGAYVGIKNGSAYWLTARLTKIRTVEVPEPSTLVLFGSGLLALSLRRQKGYRRLKLRSI